MIRFEPIDFSAALEAANEAAALAAAAEAQAQTVTGRRDARLAQMRPLLADFGLTAPLTDRQADVLRKLLEHTFSTVPLGYVASTHDNPPLAVLARMGLVSYERERIGDLGPNAHTLTVWRLKRRGTNIAIALKRGELITAEALAKSAANDRSAA